MTAEINDPQEIDCSLDTSRMWRSHYNEMSAWAADLLHVLSTMLAQGAKMPQHAAGHDCAACQRVEARLKTAGYLKG